MKTMLDAGKRFCKEIDLTEMALLKICVAAFGVLVGLGSAKRHKTGMSFLAGFALIGTAIPLIAKFLSILTSSED